MNLLSVIMLIILLIILSIIMLIILLIILSTIMLIILLTILPGSAKNTQALGGPEPDKLAQNEHNRSQISPTCLPATV